jgi:hypothetical protein
MTMLEEEISVAVTVKFYSSQHSMLLSLTRYQGTRPQTIHSQHFLPPLSSRPTPPKNSMCHGHPSHPRAQTQKKKKKKQIVKQGCLMAKQHPTGKCSRPTLY